MRQRLILYYPQDYWSQNHWADQYHYIYIFIYLDNPCPKLGNIVTVMLSENIEEVTQPDGTTVPMLVETHFQMNYTNGEWKRIKKNRRIITEESTSTTTPTPSVTATASNWKKDKRNFYRIAII